MKKAVIFTRVSSLKQDFDRQISDLKPLTKKDGYKENEIAYITHKESATKNNIQNRKSIAELKDLIDNNPIECVYITEISRLARRNDVLYNILSLLEEKKICLVVQNPTEIRTFKNGKPNPEAMLIINFMSYLAIQESEIKIERVKSGVRQKQAEGKITASKVKFGYDRDKNNKPAINEQQAEAVRDIYSMYLNGNTVGQIWQKYDGTGLFPMLTKVTGRSRMIKILKDKTYIGDNAIIKYPAIVDNQLFESVQQRLKDKTTRTREDTKVIYFCKNLIKYGDRAMTPELGKKAYTYDDRINGKRYSINVNVIDSLAKNEACNALASMNQKDAKARKKNASERLKMVEMKLSQIGTTLEELEAEKDRLNYQFQKGRLSEDKYEFSYTKVEEEIAHVYNEKEELTNTQLQLKNILSKKNFSHMEGVKNYYSLLNITDPIQCQSLVRESVREIQVSQLEKGRYKIEFNFIDESLNTPSWFEYTVRGWKIQLYKHYGDDLDVEDYTNCWEKRI